VPGRLTRQGVVRLFSERLKERRRQHGFTQAQLAEAAGIAVTYVSQLKRGETAPGIDLVARIAAALGTTIAELLSEEPSSDAPETLETQARTLFEQLTGVAGRETYLVLNPLRVLLVEAASKRDPVFSRGQGSELVN
jgi:transcriptional regulator with XRE-family HTH domain